MSVTCLYCGTILMAYYEADFDTWNFCSKECEEKFAEYLKKEAEEIAKEAQEWQSNGKKAKPKQQI